jgi:PAS domain S-box-containing protein
VLPDSPRFTVAAVTDAYLSATGKSREDLIGRGLIEVFSRGADPVQLATLAKVRESFDRVIATRLPEVMPVQQFNIVVPSAQGGGSEERYWRDSNSPMLGPGGEVQFIFHQLEDVTAGAEAEKHLEQSLVRHALLSRLMSGQRLTDDPEAIMYSCAEAVGRFLKVDRVGFFEMRRDFLNFSVGWTAGRLPLLTESIPGVAIGTLYLKEVEAGRVLGIGDARTDPLTADSQFAAIGTVALIGVPIIRDNRWHAGFYINHAEPRAWTEEEIEVARDFGEQTWDAVERIRAEAGRRKSEERLTFALEAGGGVGTWDWDIPNHRVYSDAQFAKLFSIDPERASAGAPIFEFVASIHPDDRERVQASLQSAAVAGANFSSEFRVVQPDQTVRWVYSRGRCHLNEQGQPARFPGVVFDITDRKLAEEGLRDTENQFLTLAESIPQMAWMADAEGNIFWYNRRWYDYTGATLEEMLGWGWQKVHDPSVLPRVLEAWRKSLETGEAFEMVFPLKGADGVFRSFLTRVEPVRDARGHVVRWFGTNTDITGQKKIEQDLRQANADLQQFAFAAAHDLQEPLRMVTTYTQLLSRHLASALDHDSRQYMDQVIGSSQRMSLLLKDLLAYTEASRSPDEARSPVDLESVLSKTLANLQTLILETGAELEADPLPSISGNEAHFLQLFQNLIGNALKYRGEAAPRVRISVDRQGSEWKFSFRDNGLGILPEYHDLVFGVFKRLHGKEIPGTGIGLAICQRVVERHGGRIWVESEGKGRGSSFCFTLPA